MGLRELRDLRERKYRPGHKRRPLRHKRRRPNTAVITEVRVVIREYDITHITNTNITRYNVSMKYQG